MAHKYGAFGKKMVLIQKTMAIEATSGIKKRRIFSVVRFESMKNPNQDMNTKMVLNKKTKLKLPDL